MKTLLRSARNILDYLSKSIQAAVCVLALIVIASALGTLVPQQKPYAFYLREFGISGGRLIWHAGISDIYHAAWFLALLAWLLASMAVCSLSHLKRVLLRKEPNRPEDIDPKSNEVLRAVVDHRMKGVSAEEAAETVAAISRWLGRRAYAVSAVKKDGAGYRLSAEKGRFGRFGAFIIHWGCIIVLGGGLVSTLAGTSERIQLGEHDAVAVPGSAYRVRLDGFSIEKYADTGKFKGLHKDYHSRISILDEENRPSQGEILINEPFVFDGFRFYQMDFRAAVRDVRVRLDRASDGRRVGEYPLRVGEPIDLPELGISIEAAEFLPDFVFHDGKAGSRSEEFKNPAALLKISSRTGGSAQKWVFPDMPGSLHRRDKSLPYRVRLVSFDPRYSIGLKIVKDPGRPVIYLGYVIVIFGTLLACAVFYRRLFIRVMRDPGGVVVQFVGATRRNRIGFEDEIKRLGAFLERRPGATHG